MRPLIILFISIMLMMSCKDDTSTDCSILLNMDINNGAIQGNPIKCNLSIVNHENCILDNILVSFIAERGEGVISYNNILYKQGDEFEYNLQAFPKLEFEYIPLMSGIQSLSFTIKTNTDLLTKTIEFEVIKPYLEVEIPNLPEFINTHEESKMRLIVKSNLLNLKITSNFTKGSGTVQFNKDLLYETMNITQTENIITICPNSKGESRIDFYIFNDFGSSKHYIIECLSI